MNRRSFIRTLLTIAPALALVPTAIRLAVPALPAFTTTTALVPPVNVTFQQKLLQIAKARCPQFGGSKPGILGDHPEFTLKWRRIG